MSQIQTIIRQSTRNDKRLNILCFPTFERTESYLFSRMDHNFYALRHPSWKDWKKEYAPIPKNYHLLNTKKDIKYQLPPWIVPDLILSQNRMAHFPIAKFYADKFNIPIVTCEHMSAHPTTLEAFKRQMQSMVGDINVFVTGMVRDSWGFPSDFGRIIHNAVDLDLFKREPKIEKQNYILTVANDFRGRDMYCGFNLWTDTVEHLTQYKLPVRLIGDNKGMSTPAKNTQELVQFYNDASLLLSTTLVSSLPTTIIEAMSCSLPVVSTSTTIIPTLLIKHGHNGFLSNDPKELAGYCKTLMEDDKLRKEMGENGRRWVEEKFNPQEFLDNWKNVFQETANIRK